MARMRSIHCVPRKVLWILLYCACLCVFGAGSVLAAGPPAPNGTYKKTCKNITYNPVNDGTVNATCKRLNGSWKNTFYSNCSECLAKHGDIENCDGTIKCTGVNIPNVGSYKKSCFCCEMEGSTLSCYCIKKNNVSQRTSLGNAANYGTIWNDNGVLKGR